MKVVAEWTVAAGHFTERLLAAGADAEDVRGVLAGMLVGLWRRDELTRAALHEAIDFVWDQG